MTTTMPIARAFAVTASIAGFLSAAAGSGHAAPENGKQYLSMGVMNGGCVRSVGVVDAVGFVQVGAQPRSSVDTDLRVDVGWNAAGAAYLEVPAKNVRVPLPMTLIGLAEISVPLGELAPGPLLVRIVSPNTTGSAGTGCEEIVSVA
ncbi:hypothetical protein ACFVUS_16995 [Nocardia sp. NPDC058058]|uniref:hypothetical protein n=1 Tax=Nocardia sp. NPDC058058 TaxID=3346317 RepID=UPI0036DCF3C9